MDLTPLKEVWFSLSPNCQIITVYVTGAILTGLLAIGPEVWCLRSGKIDPATGLLVTALKMVTWPVILPVSFLKAVALPW